jgi:uncharacterized protein involved in outer membrane biogenesis
MGKIIIIMVIFVLIIGVISIWLRIPPRNKAKIYMRKIKKAERKKRLPLTKEEKEEIAQKVDNIGASSGPRLDIDSVDWRFDVEDEDISYKKVKEMKQS